jgi:hypothetical protein
MDKTTRVSRRRALKYGCLAGTTAIVGCVGRVPLGNAGVGRRGAYTDWLYEPGTVGDLVHYQFYRLEPTTLDEHEDEFEDELFSNLESWEERYRHTGIDFDEMESLLTFGFNTVLTGRYDTEDVREELEENDFDDEDEHEGYTLYVRETDGKAVAVGDGAVVDTPARAATMVDAEDTLETLIDTKVGDEDRYVDESDDFDALTSALGTGAVTAGRTHEERDGTNVRTGTFDHAVATGLSVGVNRDVSSLRVVVVFAERDDVDPDDVEDWIDEAEGTDQFFDEVEDLSVGRQGRAVVVDGAIDTDELTSAHVTS